MEFAKRWSATKQPTRENLTDFLKLYQTSLASEQADPLSGNQTKNWVWEFVTILILCSQGRPGPNPLLLLQANEFLKTAYMRETAGKKKTPFSVACSTVYKRFTNKKDLTERYFNYKNLRQSDVKKLLVSHALTEHR